MTLRNRAEQDVTISLVVVVVVFVICQLMNPIRRVMAAIIPISQRQCPSDYLYFSSISTTFIIFNSSVNFAIYCVCGKRFRHRLIRLLCRRFAKIGPTTTTNTKDSSPTNNEVSELRNPAQVAVSTISSLHVPMSRVPTSSI